MDFSFPYPKLGTVRRPVGQGCTVCVHRTYCPAIYWMRRYGQGWGLKNSWTGPDSHNGIQCDSWSNNPAAKLSGIPNDRDLQEEAYIWAQGVGSEADRNGITYPSTGTNRLP